MNHNKSLKMGSKLKMNKRVSGISNRSHKSVLNNDVFMKSGVGKPSIYHALIITFLEYFTWGLLTLPTVSKLNNTFQDHALLMNGIIWGIKGLLSFLSAPLIGALSDVWGRKFFLILTVFFTCIPIPFMIIDSGWFFALTSISGLFSVTFSVIFAYVADISDERERSYYYGLITGTFGASMVFGPALGSYIMEMYGINYVVLLASFIAILNVLFIIVVVPESLPYKLRMSTNCILWEHADPFVALKMVGHDRTVLILCLTVFLSYLPEAGEYSSLFVYLRLVMGFSMIKVSVLIAVIGLLSAAIQSVLGIIMKMLGAKYTIMIGLVFEIMQLMWFGFGSETWVMWSACVLAAISSITYPAISSFISIHSDADKQGVVQGVVTGVRGLCGGLGPAIFGFTFYLFNVNLNEGIQMAHTSHSSHHSFNDTIIIKNLKYNFHNDSSSSLIPGPPFVFGSLLVVCALLVSVFIPEGTSNVYEMRPKQIGSSVQYQINRANIQSYL
ncbi:hippocampus abundant transcript 1 protein isoform X2 [Daktulosphaira vitifoliae]|uniref:hippocampus abundant transcript 1 protein isoform X2 n=1 Tax=Daktulosphaira vitifoliae TaxID=58002 RepID=UPI0021AAC70B|nr:hippocampus abundant transcript 1 protein isoform X2 [Daktulosphaira vitifoliae]